MGKLFYCPKCKLYSPNHEKIFKNELDIRKTWLNMRDGYGVPITHVICPKCNNLLAGMVNLHSNDMEEIEYFKQLIEAYGLEGKNGGYIRDGELEILIKKIKTRLNL